MERFFLADAVFAVGDTLELPAELLRHLRTVLRLPPGSEVDLFDGQGRAARAQVTADYRALVRSVWSEPPSPCRLSLIQGLPKGEKLELVLQKGTELGVSCFLPTPMVRSVGKLKADREQNRLERWQKIIREAARQSGQMHLPQLRLVPDFASALSEEADLKLLLWEQSAVPLEQALPEQAPQKVAVIVGPEGGVAPEEAAAAIAAGYQAVNLGPRILRTETAGLAIMAILQYLYGDLAKGRNGSVAVCQGKDES